MNAEYQGKLSCPQRDSAEHEGYVGAQSVGSREGKEQDGADLLERILSRENLNRACFIFLQAMGKAAASTALSMIREIVFGVGFALLLPMFFGLDGVLYSMPVSDLLTFLVALVLIVGTYRELNQGGKNL